jgi:arsenate reductase
MIKHPDLVQRPIVEKGEKAILARPPEKVRELFS